MPKKILCIDDEQEYRESIADFLRTESYEVCEASNGIQAMEQILVETPDLVLCDISMPLMNGFELLQKLRTLYPAKATVPFVFLTALNQKEDIITGRHLGCDEYIVKPVDLNVLQSIVSSKLMHAHHIERRIDKAINHYRYRTLQMMSHEMRTPLNAIIGFSELMLDEVKKRGDETGVRFDPKHIEYLKMVTKAGYEQLATINNATDTLLVVEGQRQAQIKDVPLFPLIDEVVQAGCMMTDFNVQSVSCQIHDSDAVIQADYNLLARALAHLMADAVRYRSKQRNGKMVISTRSAAKGKGVTIVLADNEGDIDKQEPANLVLVNDQETSESYLNFLRHRGVNLHFARAVAEAHGGYLQLSITPSGAGTVYFHLPQR